jgi:hypothetical protein
MSRTLALPYQECEMGSVKNYQMSGLKSGQGKNKHTPPPPRKST